MPRLYDTAERSERLRSWATQVSPAAENKLGERFDLSGFNQAVLEEGVVPLGELRAHISDWIAAHQANSSGTRKSVN